MGEQTTDGRGDSPPTTDARSDETCGHFMSEWQSGHRPRIEEALEIGTASNSIALLRNLLVIELSRRRRDGEAPDRGEYRRGSRSMLSSSTLSSAN